MLKRWAQMKASQVEARNWASVSAYLRSDETPIDYVATYRQFSDEEGLGHTYVTDRQVIITAGPPPLDVLALNLADVKLYPLSERSALIDLEVPGKGAGRVIITCAPGSDPLWHRLIPELMNRVGRGLGDPKDL